MESRRNNRLCKAPTDVGGILHSETIRAGLGLEIF